jgi:histidinol-phosphate/aromatic aminotransferase/cobyric acid decarboxylase-like protein/GNAT superfamily N-acetyltransferase
VDMDGLEMRVASVADREWIYRMRHDVYARELGQHSQNGAGTIIDVLDDGNVYLVAARGADLVGFVSVTPPWLGRYSFEKYVDRTEDPILNEDGLFEIRILTVAPRWRGSQAAPLLMYAALRWVSSRGGRRLVVMGRTEILAMYQAGGLHLLGRSITSGAVTFELMHGDVRAVTEKVMSDHGPTLRRLAPVLRWQLDMPYLPGPSGCEHGGASFDAIGLGFATLGRRHEVAAADVLDAWFPPAPGVVVALTTDPAWSARTSPPANAEGLVAQIAATRGIDAASVVVGAGSSALIFGAFRGWLTPASRVLMVDPTYGEYAHVVERVASCRVERLPVRRAHGWRIDPDELRAALRTGYDLVVLVNPNNPTGRHLDVDVLRRVLPEIPASTRIWVDEAYIDYAGPGQSLESYAAISANVVVCKSLSKMYALSGLRAAYLVAGPGTAADLRRWTPPWAVSLPAQIAAVRALQDPAYYAARWTETVSLRADLAHELALVDAAVQVDESVANFVLVTLPVGGPTAPQLVRECRRDDVFIRDLSPLSPAFEGRTVRVAVKDAAANARVVNAFRAAYRRLSAMP